MVTVVLNLGGHGETVKPCVSLQPTNTRWNDFGYNYHANVYINFGNGKTPLELQAQVIPIKSYDGKEIVLSNNFDQWLKAELTISSKGWINAETDLVNDEYPRFITLLQGETAYRQLAEIVDDQQLRAEILTKMNDLVFLRHNKHFEPLTELLMQTLQFQLGVMRTGSAFRGIHRGQRYLMGGFKSPQKMDTRSSFSFLCPLRGFQGKPHSLSVDFIDNKLLSDRIHCLVGQNGTGKSRLLREFILAVGNSAASDETVPPFIDNFESTARDDLFKFDGQDYSRVIAISSDAESNFPTAVRSDSRFEYYLINLHRSEIREGGTNISTRLLVDLMRASDLIGQNSRWQIFQKALYGYINISDIYLPLLDDVNHGRAITLDGLKWVSAATLLSIGEQSSLELFGMLDLSREVTFISEGKEISPSSGERMYFRFALNLLSFIDSGYVLVIDEPETHLHPNLVCDFMNLLYDVLTPTNSIALIATHSAYVIREVPTHCAHVYSIDENRIPSEKFVSLKTLGASVESISQAIFADSNVKKFHQRLVRIMGSEGKTIDELIQVYAGLVSPEMLSQVASKLYKDKSAAGAE
ncbi:ATP-binding protein [Leeia sp. TBRC 13508]|uniref:ATP-binding protein n=1 Tax=Leeia speluncae TaxID=2884804 RepID=A0ABS8D7W1_9NEIS|nr:AAA family ATPase [Leeia speluncae]MCB6184217.1 ATP-binding protein [Leeia speluncae]